MSLRTIVFVHIQRPTSHSLRVRPYTVQLTSVVIMLREPRQRDQGGRTKVLERKLADTAGAAASRCKRRRRHVLNWPTNKVDDALDCETESTRDIYHN